MFLGARGGYPIDLVLDLREGGHHSGNWGGLLANPGIILAHALACITDARGTILVPEWRPTLPPSVRRVLAGVEVDGGGNGPTVDRDWGEDELTPAERVFGWNSFEILAFTTGTPERPVNAIPGSARALLPTALRGRHRSGRHHSGAAPPPRSPWLYQGRGAPRRTRPVQGNPPRPRRSLGRAGRPARSSARTGRAPTIIPNTGGSLPNDSFTDILGLRTIWIPHSYGGCSQHAPDEHLLAPIVREGLGAMAGLFWDLGEPNIPEIR